VNVSAKDKATGAEQKMTITGGTALSKEEVERMVKEAEKYANEDKQRREAAEARNAGDNLAYTVETFLTDNDATLTEAQKEELQKGIAGVKAVLDGGDVAAIRNASDTLTASFQTVGSQMHQAAATPDAGDAGTDGGVVDAEIVDEGDQA
jgi:molecular chaperone DnaK